MKIVSIDIGYKNFSLYVEEDSIQNYENLICPATTHNFDGSPTKEMNDILEQLYKNGKTIYHDNIVLTKSSNCFNDICYSM